jgi:hypothetical protein
MVGKSFIVKSPGYVLPTYWLGSVLFSYVAAFVGFPDFDDKGGCDQMRV